MNNEHISKDEALKEAKILSKKIVGPVYVVLANDYYHIFTDFEEIAISFIEPPPIIAEFSAGNLETHT